MTAPSSTRAYDGLRVSLPNVPEFLLDGGESSNSWHRENGRSPDYEPYETQMFIKMLKPAPKFLDIGANIGWYSLIASAVSGGKAQIHAFEPEPKNFALLTRNISENHFDNIQAWQCALGNKNGTVNLFLSDDNIGDHRLFSSDDRPSIEIPVRRLDSVLSDSDFMPDLVKIDVQGAEVLVFKGAPDTFRRAGENMAMFIEFQPEALGMDNSIALAKRLGSFGRPMFELNPFDGGLLRPLTQEQLLQALDGCLHPRFDSHIDILIAPNDERFENIRADIGAPFEEWLV